MAELMMGDEVVAEDGTKGQVTFLYGDGGVQITYEDGAVEVVDAEGNVEVVEDVKVIETPPDPTIERFFDSFADRPEKWVPMLVARGLSEEAAIALVAQRLSTIPATPEIELHPQFVSISTAPANASTMVERSVRQAQGPAL